MRRTLALLLTLSCSTGLVADTEAGEDSSLAAGTLLRVTAPRVSKGASKALCSRRARTRS
jgi:hypothetical protein